MTLDRTMNALADPTRRAVVNLLRRKPLRAGELAEKLLMSPAALSRHLRVLRGSGLIVNDEVDGDARVRLFRLQPKALLSLRDWLDKVEEDWTLQLQSFKQRAESRAKKSRP
jgi:DNA-binding transcriptional ArsR family regulator